MGNRLLTRLAAAAAGGALVFVAAPALALDTSVVELQASHQGTFVDDGEFNRNCADPRMGPRGDDQDGWHLVASGGDIVSLTVWLAPDGDPDPAAPVEITGAPEDADSPIDFYATGQGENQRWQHAYVFTPAGWLLLTAEATLSSGNKLVVSHTCAGEPGNGATSPPPDNGETPPPGKPSEEEEEEEEEDETPLLPLTGLPVGGVMALGAGLLAAGAALMVALRRRRRMFALPEG